MAAICGLGVPSTTRPRIIKENPFSFPHNLQFLSLGSSNSCFSTLRRVRCSSSEDDKKQTPWVLKIAVTGVTELLRLFSSRQERRRFDTVAHKQKAKRSVSGIDDVLLLLQSDYENAYFLTGNFTPAIYAEDCTFEDPTIKFTGRDLYARNLKLLVPFFDHPALILQQIEKGASSETDFVLATWKLRTYLKLPWRPLISIEGSTVYDLDEEFRIVRHAESWNVSALEAVGQIFSPGIGASDE